MIRRVENFSWPGIEETTYKDEPGNWVSVTRRVLFDDTTTQFETRYFEVAPGGYTSFEKHKHEHMVVVLRGNGSVRLGDEWSPLNQSDAVRVLSEMPHQFKNEGDEPFGILCIVDKDRDRPILLDTDGQPRTSE